jgi:Ala-tRNA(Pro) deacylase
MAWTRISLLAELDRLGIAHRTVEHAPVYTVEEARAHTGHLPGAHCKNLFLKDKKGALWLVTCLDHRRLDPSRLAKALGAARLSFGRPDLLAEILGVAPGAVTPFALVNDGDRRVRPVLDAAILAHDIVNVHPLDNAATTALAASDLVRFIESLGYRPTTLDLDLLDTG